MIKKYVLLPPGLGRGRSCPTDLFIVYYYRTERKKEEKDSPVTKFIGMSTVPIAVSLEST